MTVIGSLNVHLDAAGSYLILDGQPLNATRLVGQPYLYLLDTTQFTNGAHTLQIWAHDINNTTYLSNPLSISIAN